MKQLNCKMMKAEIDVWSLVEFINIHGKKYITIKILRLRSFKKLQICRTNWSSDTVAKNLPLLPSLMKMSLFDEKFLVSFLLFLIWWKCPCFFSSFLCFMEFYLFPSFASLIHGGFSVAFHCFLVSFTCFMEVSMFSSFLVFSFVSLLDESFFVSFLCVYLLFNGSFLSSLFPCLSLCYGRFLVSFPCLFMY